MPSATASGSGLLRPIAIPGPTIARFAEVEPWRREGVASATLFGPTGSEAAIQAELDDDIELLVRVAGFSAGAASPQRPPSRTHEVLLAVDGRFAVIAGSEQVVLEPWDCCLVPAGVPRRVTNLEGRDSVIVSLIVASIEHTLAHALQVARFAALRPLRRRGLLNLAPRAFVEQLSPRDLFLLVGPKAGGRPGMRHALQGPERFCVALARTPAGNGPAAHVHTRSDELFLVVQGRYEVVWGDDCERSVELGPFDLAHFRPGINRTFRALDDGSAMLPIVVGTDDELADLAWLPAVERELAARVPRFFLAIAKLCGLRFTSRHALGEQRS